MLSGRQSLSRAGASGLEFDALGAEFISVTAEWRRVGPGDLWGELVIAAGRVTFAPDRLWEFDFSAQFDGAARGLGRKGETRGIPEAVIK